MEYKIKELVINDLISLYEQKKLNLNPPYQRNDIWPPLSKKRLIESVRKGYPLPSFFLHKKEGELYDMVDGQQRTRTFMGYKKGLFPDTNRNLYNEASDKALYDSYKLCVVVIETQEGEAASVEDFYYRVNKFGVKLNRPEIKRAEFFSSSFQQLIEKIAAKPEFEKLNLFTEKSSERLNDLDFVAELLTLIKLGITDKKIAVDKLYESEMSEGELNLLDEQFGQFLDIVNQFNQIYPIDNTRYKQRNDFYTLISFISKHKDLPLEVLNYQYKVLVLIGEEIYPTNDKCWPFQEYANNCVSQSNSKKAREERLKFFEHLLLNSEPLPSTKYSLEIESEYNDIVDVMQYLHQTDNDLCKVGSYYLLDLQQLNQLKPEISFS